MSTKRIILISGYARSGKDFLASALERELAHCEPVRVKFANELKTALGNSLVSHLGLMDVDVFTEDDVQKKALRPLLVEFGKFARSIDKDVFVNAAWNTICDLFENGKGVAIVPDLRYSNEINLISERAKERDWKVVHLRIGRWGTQAANEEELQSINALPSPDVYRIYTDGDLEGIERWAKEICSKPSVPVQMPTIPVGGITLGNHEYAKPNKGTAKWTGTFNGPNGEPVFVNKVDNPQLFGHTHNPTPAPVEQQLKALWDESLCLDETIDRVSKRVDHADERITRVVNYAIKQTERLSDKIRELEARIEKMEGNANA